MLLSVIAAMHDCGVSASAPDGPLSRGEEEEEEEEDEDEDFPSRRNRSRSGNDRGLEAGTGPEMAPARRPGDRDGGASTSATLVAEAFDAVGSALARSKRSAAAASTSRETPSVPGRRARRRIASATLDALALPGGGQRSA